MTPPEAWLGRGRYERKAEALPGKRNGWRPKRLQSAEGEIDIQIPQVREAAEPFVSKLFPRGKRFLRTEPLKAMVIGAFVRGPTRSTCRCARRAPRRASCAPGGSTRTASACCSGCSWACASPRRIGCLWAVT